MIGGPDEAVERLDPIFATLAPGVDAAERTPGPQRRPDAGRERLPALRPERRRPLREDGPQRDRVRGDGRLRRGPQHPQATPTSARSSARPTPRPRRSSDPEYYQYEHRHPRGRRGLAPRQRGRLLAARPDRRGAAASRPTSRSSRAASRTRARAAGRRSPRSRRACPAPVLTTALYERFASRDLDDFADKVLSAMRKQFGGHDEKQAVSVAHRARGRSPTPTAVARARRRADRRGRRARPSRERGPLRARGQRRPRRRGAMFALLGDHETAAGREIEIFQVDERVAPAGDRRPQPHPPAARASRPAPRRSAAPDAGRPTTTSRRPPADYAASLPERLDLVHLGLGPDGHTASLVPGDPVLEVTRPPRRGHRRQLPGPPPDDAHLPGARRGRAQVLWLVTGEDKVERWRSCSPATVDPGRAASRRASQLARSRTAPTAIGG